MFHQVPAVTRRILLQHEPGTPPVPIYGKSLEKGTLLEPTVDKALNIEGPYPSSAAMPERREVDGAYVDW